MADRDVDTPPWDVDALEAADADLPERDPNTSDMFGAPAPAPAAPPPAADAPAYQVLARKYRPRRFEDLIGQEAMVKTLTNAFATGRVAHGFMLTGVRGVGKTTTARLLARALNYESDTVHRPTVDLSVEGRHCRAIIEGRHMDVLELDAASRTGVDDMREILDGVRYAPVEARFKVYVIDEVHMLSKGAFNALLKTLEEPPSHAKFIFATTEIRKVPVTILSRCQRFDLRRVEPDVLGPHLAAVAASEGAALDEEATSLLARAAEGSVRDGLSLLDQAIVQAEEGAPVSAAVVRDMLGLADREATLTLFEAVMRGDAAAALTGFRALYGYGADPAQVILDLLEAAHGASIAKAIGSDVLSLPRAQAARLTEVGGQASAGVLSRVWQLLLKAHDEVRRAPDAAAAAEMAILRLCYAADLPGPEEALRALQEGRPVPPAPGGGGGGGGAPRAAVASGASGGAMAVGRPMESAPAPASAPRAQAQSQPQTQPQVAPGPQTFAAILDLIRTKGDMALQFDVERFVRPVSVAEGVLAVGLEDKAPRDLTQRLAARLQAWTGRRWLVDVRGDVTGEETQYAQARRAEAQARAEIEADPFVRALLDAFPGARVAEVRTRAPAAATTVETGGDPDGEFVLDGLEPQDDA